MLHHPIYPSHPWRDMPRPARALRSRSSTSITSISCSRVTITPTSEPTRSAATRTRNHPPSGTIYLMAVSGDKFVESTEARLRRSRPLRRLDLSDVRDRLAIESADVSRLDRGRQRIIDELSIAKPPTDRSHSRAPGPITVATAARSRSRPRSAGPPHSRHSHAVARTIPAPARRARLSAMLQ